MRSALRKDAPACSRSKCAVSANVGNSRPRFREKGQVSQLGARSSPRFATVAATAPRHSEPCMGQTTPDSVLQHHAAQKKHLGSWPQLAEKTAPRTNNTNRAATACTLQAPNKMAHLGSWLQLAEEGTWNKQHHVCMSVRAAARGCACSTKKATSARAQLQVAETPPGTH